MEPPSPILTEQKLSSGPNSDDPLSQTIYMIVGNPSDGRSEGYTVCAWSAHTGLSYIGTSDGIAS